MLISVEQYSASEPSANDKRSRGAQGANEVREASLGELEAYLGQLSYDQVGPYG